MRLNGTQRAYIQRRQLCKRQNTVIMAELLFETKLPVNQLYLLRSNSVVVLVERLKVASDDYRKT